MASLFRERTRSTHSRRDSDSGIGGGGNASLRLSTTSSLPSPLPASNADSLPCPFGDLGCPLSPNDLRDTAYEIFVAACRTAGSKPLASAAASTPDSAKYHNNHQLSASPSISSSSLASPASSGSTTASSSALHRSITSTAASRMKKALGLKSSSSKKAKDNGGSSVGTPPKARSKPNTVGELMRVQMGVSELTDARIRKGLLRISAVQLGRRTESMILPLELLQQFKASDFPDHQEYEAWQTRNLKILEAGLLLHPHMALDKSDAAAQRLRQIIRGASEKPLETGRNCESMQVLRSAVMSLACRSYDGSSMETYHWADGIPLNLHLYRMLLEACFDSGEEGSILEEVDELMELIKKTWGVLGVDEMLHNLCFTWTIFSRFVSSSQEDVELLIAAENQLAEVAADAKATKDPVYSKILSATLSSILGWTEKRLLAYHDTFTADNIESLHCIVSLGVAVAKILVEDVSHEYRRKRREEVDIARTRIDTYIRSSVRTAFAQRMEQADSSRRASRNQINPAPLLSILAKDTADLATKEKESFSPILKKWHPLAAGVAVATLHTCFRNELKQFISGVSELTPDTVLVLKAADKLEKDLVQIAVEDAVDSEDGGKAIIREMPPYEAELTISNLTRTWIKKRVDWLRELVDRSLQQEVWNPTSNKESIAPSVGDILRVIDETCDAFFQLPIPMHPILLPDLVVGLDRGLQHYISKVKAGCGTKNTFIPALPTLTRCEIGSKFQWKKKEKPRYLPKMKSQVGSVNGSGSLTLQQLCVRMNTLQHIVSELENIEKRIITSLRNSESAHGDVAKGLDTKFELSLASCQEGIQFLCESTAYKVIFHDLAHVLWDSLYVGEVAASRIEPLLKDLDPCLGIISNTAHARIRNRLVTVIMKASFDGFLLVLLGGGPSRAFTRQDSQMIEDDFRSLKDLFLADGDGLPEEVVEKASTQVRNVLPLFRADTEGLIERYRRMIIEAHGSAAKSKLPLPPTSGQWNPTEANTMLRVLCYRNDEAASRFLKKTYALPKKL